MAHGERATPECLLDVIGHRGGAALALENTLAAIDAGLDAGADGVEVDVRRTTDGALVLMHDPDLGRTTAGTGRIDETTLDVVMALGVPTLEEAMAHIPGERLLVAELKGHPWESGYDPGEPVARAVASLLRGLPPRRVVVSSFNPLALQVIREQAPGVRTAVLTSPAFDLASNLAAAVDAGHEECHVPARILTEGFVEDAHASEKRVVAWTVDDPEELRRFDSWGVDGVITDDPRAAREALRRSG